MSGQVKSLFKELDPKKIHRNPNQPRKKFHPLGLKKLAFSVKKVGILQPVVVIPHPEIKNEHMIMAGERRWRAALLAGLKKIPCVIRIGDLKPYIGSVIENFLREDLNPIEEALANKQMREEEKLTLAEIEERTGRSIVTIENKLKLLDLPLNIQGMIIEGTLPQGKALQLAQFKKKFDPETRRLISLANELVAGKIPLELGKSRGQVSENKIRGKLPQTPEGLLRRILAMVWRVPSFTILLEAFLALPREEQRQVFYSLNNPTRENLQEKLAQMIDSCHGLLQGIGELRRVITPNEKPHQKTPVEERPEFTGAFNYSASRQIMALTRYLLEHLHDENIYLGLDILKELWNTRAPAEELPQILESTLKAIKENWSSQPTSNFAWQNETMARIVTLREQSGCKNFDEFWDKLREKVLPKDALLLI